MPRSAGITTRAKSKSRQGTEKKKAVKKRPAPKKKAMTTQIVQRAPIRLDGASTARLIDIAVRLRQRRVPLSHILQWMRNARAPEHKLQLVLQHFSS